MRSYWKKIICKKKIKMKVNDIKYNQFSNFTELINTCLEKDCFGSDTFLISPNGILIAITEKNVCSKKTVVSINGRIYQMFQLNLNICLSLILERSPLLTLLFSGVICVRDDLDICRKIYLAIKPIEEIYGKLSTENLDFLWDKMLSNVENKDELSIRFDSIGNDIKTYHQIILPILSLMSQYLKNNQGIVQFYKHNYNCYAVYTLYINKQTQYEKLLEKVQLYLYEHSPELYLQSIQIPYVRVKNHLEILDSDLYQKVVEIVAGIQEYILTLCNSEKDNSNLVITEVIYAYIFMAKICYKDISLFYQDNIKLYRKYTHICISDNMRYIVNNNVNVIVKQKLHIEIETMCRKNYGMIYSNYFETLKKWQNLDEHLRHFELEQTLTGANFLTAIRGNKQRLLIFQEVTNMLFHTFLIDSYYQTYITYVPQFLRNGI